MTENRSLDDFLGGDSATEGESDGDDESAEDADGPPAGGGSEADAADGSTTDAADGPPAGDESATDAADESVESAAESEETEDAPDASPAVATYRWDPAGVACPACGETVDRLWLDDGEQVCADCKAW